MKRNLLLSLCQLLLLSMLSIAGGTIAAQSQPPVIICPPNAVLTCDVEPQTAATTITEFIALGGAASDDVDAIGDLTITSSDADNGGTNCPGDGRVVNRTYSITDTDGNTSSCTHTFTYLESTLGPAITSIQLTSFVECADDANGWPSCGLWRLDARGRAADDYDLWSF